jgi:hypothetical protein
MYLVGPDPDRRKNWKSDLDRHQNVADPQHVVHNIFLCATLIISIPFGFVEDRYPHTFRIKLLPLDVKKA